MGIGTASPNAALHVAGDDGVLLGPNAASNGKTGSFVFSDNSSTTTVSPAVDNQFVVRATGGTAFFSSSDLSSGVVLSPGAGAWNTISDRRKKEHFRDEDGETVLEKIAGMPIQSWNYIAQDDAIRHLGPMAQDFYAAFAFGESDTTITTTDIDGINMLAIQALERRTREVETLTARLAATEVRLARLETVLFSADTASANR